MTIYEWNNSSIATPTTVTTATATVHIDSAGRMRRDVPIAEVERRLQEAEWFKAALPCIVCRKALPGIMGASEGNQPSGGVGFDSDGNYGSRVFDPPNGFVIGQHDIIAISVCDECLTEASREGCVTFSKAPPRTDRPRRIWRLWTVRLSSRAMKGEG